VNPYDFSFVLRNHVYICPTFKSQRRALGPVRCTDWFDSVVIGNAGGAANFWFGNKVTMLAGTGMPCRSPERSLRSAGSSWAIMFEWKWDSDFAG